MHQVEVGDSVSVRNDSRGPKWIPGTIIQETGPLSARTELEVVRRHFNQLVAQNTESFNPGVALPITSPLQQEGVDPEIIVPDVNDPEVSLKTESHPVQQWFRTHSQPPYVKRYPARSRNPTKLFTNGLIP